MYSEENNLSDDNKVVSLDRFRKQRESPTSPTSRQTPADPLEKLLQAVAGGDGQVPILRLLAGGAALLARVRSLSGYVSKQLLSRQMEVVKGYSTEQLMSHLVPSDSQLSAHPAFYTAVARVATGSFLKD